MAKLSTTPSYFQWRIIWEWVINGMRSRPPIAFPLPNQSRAEQRESEQVEHDRKFQRVMHGGDGTKTVTCACASTHYDILQGMS